MSSIFGWDYPPGCSSVPGDDEQVIDLAADKCIIGYGRKCHGMNGKDADLDYGGQNVVKEAYWFEDGSIRIYGTRYASIVPNQDATESQMDLATEIVCGCSYPGEWDGDYWVMSDDYDIKANCDWDDELTEEQNIEKAKEAAADAIGKDSRAFESEMTELAKAVESATASEGDSNA